MLFSHSLCGRTNELRKQIYLVCAGIVIVEYCCIAVEKENNISDYINLWVNEER